MEPTSEMPVIVIGAGLSGLACARILANRGIPVKVLEARHRVGEPWRSRHPALRLNIHRHFARLPGQEAPRGDGPFLRRDTVVEHLERYADGLGAKICHGTEVTGLTRQGRTWRVETNSGILDAAHVVFATGRDRVPHVPDWPGRADFTGAFLHAADLGDVSRFNGKRVLVIGAGNSGSDVLNHLSRHAPAEVLVSVRHGPAVVPTRIFGFPLHRLARVFAAMPVRLLDPAFRLTQRLFLGDLARFGLKSHPDGGGTRMVRDGIAFAIDDGFVSELKNGRLEVVPEVVRFDRGRVILAGGGQCSPDVVIAATGYRSGLETLLGPLGVLGADGQPIHPMGEPDPAHPGLWFTGFRPMFTGYFDAARIAAERIADVIAAQASPMRPRRPSHTGQNSADLTARPAFGAGEARTSFSTTGETK